MYGGPIVPCIWLDDRAEEAARLYTETLPGGRIHSVSHYPSSGENPSGKPPGSVLTVEFEAGGLRFTTLNGGPAFGPNPSISFFVRCGTAAEVDRLHGVLAEGGSALMPLDAYPWSRRYAWVQDRFGVSWQLLLEEGASGGASIFPALMFAGQQAGRASEAMQAYVRAFPGAALGAIARYEPGEGPTDFVKHGRFTLGGQAFAAMDNPMGEAASFDEGLSLQVMCRDQGEVDRYWEALSEGGEKGPCGWLKDRFGLSWQVVPEALAGWISHPDVEARDRVFRAVMEMRRPVIAELQAALRGG